MMKKLLPLLLLLLFLAGCGDQQPQTPSGETNDATEQAQKGLYDPASTIEKETYGAIRAYPLEKNNCVALSAMGSRLLLVTDDGTLTVLQGDTCVEAATLSTGIDLAASRMSFDSSVQGAACYDRDTRQVVLLNPQLQETDRLELPEDIQGEPYISLARNEVFYCVPGEIRALNTQTGISRPIRSHSYPDQYLLGTWFDGELLLCSFGTDGPVEYISTDTGKTAWEAETCLYPFHTWEDAYLLSRMDGAITQTVVGQREGQPLALNISEEFYTTALPLGGVVGYTSGTNPTLRYYDLASGKCTAQVTLYGAGDPTAFLATQEYLWILACEGEQQVLYRWDITKSPANDDTVYTGELITSENPDIAGLEACRTRAAEMSEAHGVKIHIWEDALQVNGGYSLVAEYQVETISSMLDQLETALQIFPEAFLQKTVEAGWVHINLVRRVDEDVLSARYWHEGDCYIAIGCTGSVTDEFLRGVAYAIDSRVLGNSRKFDDWNDLNPEGFAYSYSDEPRDDRETWLGGDSAFLSIEALNYPHDDRSSVFFYAVTANGEDAFDSDVMQAKLERLCRGIREAYGLEKSPDTYLWEQYLTESLAYTQ